MYRCVLRIILWLFFETIAIILLFHQDVWKRACESLDRMLEEMENQNTHCITPKIAKAQTVFPMNNDGKYRGYSTPKAQKGVKDIMQCPTPKK